MLHLPKRHFYADGTPVSDKSSLHDLRLLRVDAVHKRYQFLREKLRALSSLNFRKVDAGSVSHIRPGYLKPFPEGLVNAPFANPTRFRCR